MRQTPITISVEDEAPLRAAIARGDLAAVRAMAEGPWPISFADLDRALAWMRLHPGDPVSGRLGSIRDDEAYGPIAARLVGLGEERLMWSMRGAAPDALITHSAPSQLRRSVRRGLLVPESVGLHSLDLTRRRVQANCDLSVLIEITGAGSGRPAGRRTTSSSATPGRSAASSWISGSACERPA